uniref:Uncharacterized protein n=1 Tax=Triticum urartu TaxID=4572 RepID=A0A8R7NYJ0_TRIUA
MYNPINCSDFFIGSASFHGEIVTFQPQALYTEEETEICAMRLHIQICTEHQGFWPGIRSSISCISGHFGLHVKVMKRSG